MKDLLRNKFLVWPAISAPAIEIAFHLIIPFFFPGWDGFPVDTASLALVVAYFGVGLFVAIWLLLQKQFKNILFLSIGYVVGAVLAVLFAYPVLIMVCGVHGLCL